MRKLHLFTILVFLFTVGIQAQNYTFVHPGINVLSSSAISGVIDTMDDGDVIILDEGVYIQTVPVVIPRHIKRITIKGYGMGKTIIKFTQDVDGIKQYDATVRMTYVLFEGFTVQANFYDSDYNRTGIQLTGESVNNNLCPGRNITLRDIAVIGGRDGGATHYWGTCLKGIHWWNSAIVNCNFEGSKSIKQDVVKYLKYGVILESCVNMQINGSSWSMFDTAIEFRRWPVVGHGCEGVKLDNANIIYCKDGVIFGEKSLSCSVVNSVVDIFFDQGIDVTDESLGHHRIIGNWIARDGNPVNVSLETTIIRLAGIYGGNVISDNIITGGNALRNDIGIFTTEKKNIISNNRIRFCYICLYFQGEANRNSVVGNVVSADGCYHSVTNVAYGIVMTSDECVFLANVIEVIVPGKTAYGIVFFGGADNNIFSQNQVCTHGAAGNDIVDYGSGNIKANNK